MGQRRAFVTQDRQFRQKEDAVGISDETSALSRLSSFWRNRQRAIPSPSNTVLKLEAGIVENRRDPRGSSCIAYTANPAWSLHLPTDFLRVIDAQRAETVLTAKGNQPTLYADLATFLLIRRHGSLQSETTDDQWGHIEVHCIKVSTEMNAYLASCWSLIAEAHSTHPHDDQSEPRALAVPQSRALSIENHSHYVRDASFKEDRTRLRTGNASQIVASFRNLALSP